ncbi:uncharacterized protein LOC118809635 [Colossoma macropomum]|uniref:uncharacterized protein LOC118809635 n=1 Tax=Colossoma macropomum TaxID=42526 RepID=UPI001864C43C|nr:uncharacterized protein LOC118809635 [Colossoma macropomum]XP_036429003.1 uncharacterized protein LOC118809635 [Colossoma macropomum]XP_036429004.1 uncharacterized protein LOC118809635 [Colossoma macropomum]
MATEGRTVKVSGLPVHMSENRLVDKIHIHFLRKKNGGGEISSVTVSKSTPGTAFITFEENKVALRLAEKGKQVFKVNDKSYDVKISLHHKEVDPDEVLLYMSLTVDHNKLPEGKRSLLSLHETFPDIRLTFDPQTDLCTLSGSYTKVQSLSSLILGSLESQKQNSGGGIPSKKKSQEKHSLPPEKTDNNPLGANIAAGGAKYAPHTDKLDLEMESTVWKTGGELYDYSSNIQQASHEDFMEDKWDLEPDDGTSFEDFSLAVDSDIFLYLHKYCNKEYQSILRRHRVEVLDVTCEDITTLYLKPKKTLSERGMSSVGKAHQDLANLYQEKGSQLRRENISKSGIPVEHLEHALESLKERLPKLMIDEDKGNVYLVGSKSDVSEAKQFIVDVKGIRMDKDINSDHPFTPFQPTFLAHQGGSLSLEQPAEQSGLFQPTGGKFQGSDDLFNPRKDYQKTSNEEIHASTEIKPTSGEVKRFDDHTHSGLVTLQTQTKAVMDEDIFLARRNYDTSEEKPLQKMECGGWYDKDKYVDSLFLPPKSSSIFSSSDVNKRPLDNPHFISEETKLKGHPDTTSNGLEKQHKSGKGHKTKRAESGRELKMAANFSKGASVGVTESAWNSKDAENQKTAPKLEEVVSVNEKSPDSKHPHSLPFIKPSMNSNLKPNTMSGNTVAKGSVLSKMDAQILKADLKKPGQFPSNLTEKKPIVMPAYSIDSHSFSLGHMDLCGDIGINKNPTVPSGSTRKRSNSFSGKVRKSKDEPAAVDLFGGQKERSQGSQTKEVTTVDIRVSIRLWLYLKSVYTTEIDNLTSDLQIKETYDKEDVILCLRGADPEKVNKCHRDLKSLIGTVEMDFDTRTLPLSILGLSDPKDKTLAEFCSVMKQLHEKVKTVVMSRSVMILGPVSACQEVEATMMEVFHTGVSDAKAQMESWEPHKPSSHEVRTTNSDANHPTPTGENAQTVSKNYLPKISGQSSNEKSNNVPRLLEDRTRDTTLDAVNKDNQEQDNYNKMEGEQGTEERTQGLDKKGRTLKVQLGEDWTMNKGSVKADNVINSGSEDEANGTADGDHRTTTTLWKYSDQEGHSQMKGTLIKQVHLGGSVDQMDVPQPLKVTSTALPSYVSENQGFPLSCVCGAQSSTVNRTACGMNLCSQCLKETHASCKLCPAETKQDTRGIKGTMSVRESTITIPGFIRDTTLKIVYEIPDGIQGEGHPCPGAPFKGDRFEAYLPT